ncbi:MAG: pilus assembly protein HicB [Pseudomonadota bacterium]|jgi:hypothetical protein|nr:pilus assembly protein HicB [Pseudomonadota bacterium]
MTQTQRYKYPLQLPQSLKKTATRLAMEDGVSLNQWTRRSDEASGSCAGCASHARGCRRGLMGRSVMDRVASALIKHRLRA